MLSAVKFHLLVFMLMTKYCWTFAHYLLFEQFKHNGIDRQFCWCICDFIIKRAFDFIILWLERRQVALFAAGVTARQDYGSIRFLVITSLATLAYQKGFHFWSQKN